VEEQNRDTSWWGWGFWHFSVRFASRRDTLAIATRPGEPGIGSSAPGLWVPNSGSGPKIHACKTTPSKLRPASLFLRMCATPSLPSRNPLNNHPPGCTSPVMQVHDPSSLQVALSAGHSHEEATSHSSPYQTLRPPTI
jgi:hypothetical protein